MGGDVVWGGKGEGVLGWVGRVGVGLSVGLEEVKSWWNGEWVHEESDRAGGV